MIVTNLSHLSIDVIIDCFYKAFANYFVALPTDRSYFKKRWQASKVRYDLSYGMFDKDQLVAFILHGIDERHGEKMAYNAGTGVIPEYRGRHLVKALYDFALADLKEKGMTKSVLEVITLNETAIKAYKGVGFEVSKHLKCYSGHLSTMPLKAISIREVTFPDLDWGTLPNQKSYAWDHQHYSLKAGDYRYYQVMDGQHPQSYFVINGALDSIAQWDVLASADSAWTNLFSGMSALTDAIKINNVDALLSHKVNALQQAGFTNVVDQYEMELQIT